MNQTPHLDKIVLPGTARPPERVAAGTDPPPGGSPPCMADGRHESFWLAFLGIMQPHHKRR